MFHATFLKHICLNNHRLMLYSPIRLFSFIGVLFLTQTAFAQTEAEEGKVNRFGDKDQCATYAQENHKNILMVFAGSDWCKPCMQFKKDILLQPEFSAYSKEHLAILYLDFPMKKKNKLPEEQTKHNEALAEQYNKGGSFPKIVLMDEKMNVIKELKYTRQSAEDFIKSLE